MKGMEWLMDVDRPLVLEGPEWPERQRQVKALPKWY